MLTNILFVGTERTGPARARALLQSSILAQYILLLLTDYCTKGYCNPGDQKFAIEMGRQGIQEGKNISLYAVSKAMGFIPRNKLGHSFFRWARCASRNSRNVPRSTYVHGGPLLAFYVLVPVAGAAMRS